jgi:pimeloyl-ACP methyl ester carboxylesterase
MLSIVNGRSRDIEEGLLEGGLPYRAVGVGPTLLYLPPFAPHHQLTSGLSRLVEVNILRAFAAGGFRVYQINRRVGLAPGTTMTDLAAQYARAIKHHFPQPVRVLGFSTGGAIALNLAADHPELIARLVLASAAHRLSPIGWEACRKAAERAEAGDRRGFQVAMAPTAARSRLGQTAAALFGWLLAPLTLRRDWNPSDAIITLRADMTIDVASRLDAITAPTLIIGGEWDPSYPPDIMNELVNRLKSATYLMYPRTGHGVVIKPRFVQDLTRFLHAGEAVAT